MKHPTISALIEARGGGRVALSLRNNGNRDAYLYRPNACSGGKIDNDVFVIHQGASPIAFTGRYVKRPAPRPLDFLVLPPLAISIVEIDLASVYTVAFGATYSVFYQAFHDNPESPDDLWEVTSNTIALGG